MKNLIIFGRRFSDSAIQRFSDSAIQRFLTFKWMAMVPLLLLLNSCQKNEKPDFEKTTVTVVEKRTGDCAENAFLDWDNFCSPFTPVVTKTKVITNVPGYPSTCSFTIQYDIKKCVLPVVNEVHVLIGNFKIIAINCPQYHSDIYDITYNPGIGIPTLSDYLNNLFDNLVRILEDIEFIETLASYNLDCNVTSTNHFVYSTNYYEQSCNTYCVPYGQRPNEFEPALKLSCGEECCRTEVYMCYDYVNSKIVKSVVKTPLFGGSPDCNPLQNLASICASYSDCEVNCE
ncbi:MAG: hypothetical protein WAT79_06270 [Saprospiraceae bacterium]